jgi:large subunit ribosomal protein L9
MEVLLIQDVDNLGYAGDVKQVKNGFGRNYLLPQRLAILATPGSLKQSETIRRTAEKHRAQELEDAKAIANQIADLKLIFERRAGETGKLYGSVTSVEIVKAIEDKTGIAIDKRKIFLPEPIRQLGEYAVTIKIVMDLSINIQVEVLPEGGIAERARFLAKKAAEEQAKQELKEKLEAEKAKVAADNEAKANQLSEPEPVEETSLE